MNYRNARGRYSSFRRMVLWSVVIGAVLVLGSMKFVEPWINKELKVKNVQSIILPQRAEADEVKPDRLEQKIDQLKADVVNQISKCESGQTKEPDAAIILDTNNEMSVGSMMFQLKTVQHYVKQFEARDI